MVPEDSRTEVDLDCAERMNKNEINHVLITAQRILKDVFVVFFFNTATGHLMFGLDYI